MQTLEFFSNFARHTAFALGIPVGQVARLPTETRLWTVPKSPFVHKKVQENFWRKTHKRAIKVYDANDEVVDRWLQFLRIWGMPGVGMKAQLFRYHELGVGKKMLEQALNPAASSEQQRISLPATSAAEQSAEETAASEATPLAASSAGGVGNAAQIKAMADELLKSGSLKDSEDTAAASSTPEAEARAEPAAQAEPEDRAESEVKAEPQTQAESETNAEPEAKAELETKEESESIAAEEAAAPAEESKKENASESTESAKEGTEQGSTPKE